jgi:hypothetical protein
MSSFLAAPELFLPKPELVWGLLPRLIGVLYMIAFGGVAPQLVALIGSRGIGPIQPRYACAKRDYPGLRRFFYFPTILWFFNSDRALRVIPLVGVAAGAFCVYGGPYAPLAHALCWLLWLSIEPAALIFPWDTMLEEAGFLALFLPSVQALPNLETSALPWPSVAFMIRWFVIRLMWGFAKLKFIGTTKNDTLYLRGFFVWAPSPTPLAWFGHHLPAWMLRLMLYYMFLAEAIAPGLGLFSGPLRLVSFALLAGLMVGIQATGNWGFFNVGYIFLLLSLLDVNASIFDLGNEPWRSQLGSPPIVIMHVALGLMFLTSLLYLVVFDSWTMRTLLRWPLDMFTWKRAWLRWLLAYLRALMPFRIVNGYGVFPPNALAPLRHGVLFEGSHDGVTWKAYGLRRMPTRTNEWAQFVAPYQARIDMALCYAGGCVFDASFYGSLIGDGTPYTCYTRVSWLERLCQRIMEREPSIMKLMGDDPFADGPPPRLMRVSVAGMTPAPPEVRRATGQVWHVQRLGVITPPHEKSSFAHDVALPEPEVFHPDWVDYKRAAAPLRAMRAAFAAGVDVNQAVLSESDLTAGEVQRFWHEFVPAAKRNDDEFAVFRERAQALEDRFGRMQMVRFERLLERFSWLLRGRTERHQFADAQPELPLESNFRYHLFLQQLVLDGEQAYRGYLDSAERVVERLKSSSDLDQIWGLSMLRADLMIAHVLAFRWTQVGRDAYRMKAPGLFEYYPILAAYVPKQEEFALEFIGPMENGEHVVPGFYPPPREVMAAAAPAE